MEELKLNETPVRTARNFNINNIKLKNVVIPEEIKKFENVNIFTSSDEIKVKNIFEECKLQYGVGDILTDQVKNSSNCSLKIVINSKANQDLKLNFILDEKNLNLIDNLEIVANEETKATVYLKYETENEDLEGFHNEILKVFAKKKSNLNIVIVNLTNIRTNNFISIDNEIDDNASVNYTIVDFGGKNSVTNLYSNLVGKESKNCINTIYLGRENQILDLNYIGELRGEKSDINIEVQGAIKDNARKHFKGTIDFKKGCKKAKGNENEFCILLSDTAKSLALPMLLCSEEEVEGNHSSAAGKIGDNELFYIMSRGFELKEARKLLVRAKFNTIIEGIADEELKNVILKQINERLN